MRRKMLVALFVGGLSVGVVASPAMAHTPEGSCPPGWSMTYDHSADPDRNGDGWHCYKHLPKHGVQGGNIFQNELGENHKDNNRP